MTFDGNHDYNGKIWNIFDICDSKGNGLFETNNQAVTPINLFTYELI